MEREGPMLETLLQRLADTPEEFLGEPQLGSKGTVQVSAVVADLCRGVGVSLTTAALTAFSQGATRNSLSVSLLLCWLVLDDSLRSALLKESALFNLLNDGARELAEHTQARKFLTQSERREELARFTLARLALRPAGETQAQAEDRLTSLSAAERARVLKAAREDNHPALPYEHPCPTRSRSRTVTTAPRRASSTAHATPITPPPMIATSCFTLLS